MVEKRRPGQPGPTEKLRGNPAERARALRRRVAAALGLKGRIVINSQELRHPAVEHVKIALSSPAFEPADPASGITHLADFPQSTDFDSHIAQVVVGTF